MQLKSFLSSRFVVTVCCWWIIISAVSLADQLHLKNGRIIEAEETWEVGGEIWYRQGKVLTSISKGEVVKVVKIDQTKPHNGPKANAAAASAPIAQINSQLIQVGAPGVVYAAPPPAADTLAATNEETKKTSPAKATVSRILLKDGVKIDADYVWEEPERVGYRLGKMQTFVARAIVQKIIYEVVEEPPPAPLIKFTTGHRGLDQLLVYSAAKYNVNPLLIYLLMRQESGFNQRAVSRVGARGLMQLMPETARRLGVRNIDDPVENVEAGTRYLKSLIRMFNGDVNLALAGYNAGENAVIRYGYRIPPYRETQNYVYSINAAYQRAKADGLEPQMAPANQP